MIDADSFLSAAARRGFDWVTGTPCSYLKPLINRAIDHPGIAFVPAVNEGDAVAIAAGAWLGGRRPVVMFQNSGLGNAVNPITSLSQTFRMPFLGIVSWRGQPDGAPDEPQHGLMGAITTDLLELMDVAWAPFPAAEEEIDGALDHADTAMRERQRPFFLVMKQGDVLPCALAEGAAPVQYERRLHPTDASSRVRRADESPDSRTEALRCLKAALSPQTAIIATTGKTGRELFELGDEARLFYMVGSMGCALSIGLGLALSRPERPVCVVDGDGALMMRMGAMATVGRLAPANLIHIVLDNGVHDSTGGQRTGSEALDFCGVADAAGYRRVAAAADTSELGRCIEAAQRDPALAFIHCPIRPGSPATLARPTVQPPEVARRMRAFVAERLA